MGTVGSRSIIAVLVLILAAAPSWAKTGYNSGIWTLLRAGGFSFSENGESRARKLGSIVVGDGQYQIWSYFYASKTGSRHGHSNILVFKRSRRGLSYFGNYSVDWAPGRIDGRTIKFNYGNEDVGEGYPPAKRGDEIVFGGDGPPPAILLDGEFHWFDPASHHIGTWHAMDVGRFSGMTDIDAEIWPVGSIEAGGKRYQIWGYSWKQTPQFKNDLYKQERHKVLVFDENRNELTYLGGYEVDDVPFHIEGQTIRFDLPAVATGPGEDIAFNESGPPVEAHLNGRLLRFAK